MPNKSAAEMDILVTVAAGLFVMYTRDAKEIAGIMNTTERSIHRYAEREKWEEVLQALHYEGDRSFRVETTRDTQRDYGEVLDAARDLYLAAIDKGHSSWKATGIVEEKLGVNRRTVEKWALRFGWRNNT